MTPRTNARVAGVTFLLYIVTGLTQLALYNRATGGTRDPAAVLASLAQHSGLVRITVPLGLLQAIYAVVLGVTLYALTRGQDRELALLGLTFRAGEGLLNGLSVVQTLALLTLATGATAAAAPDAALSALLVRGVDLGAVSAICFACGSTLFCWLFLQARSIPAVLAWLGLLGSSFLALVLPVRLAGFIGPLPAIAWIPMAVFEVWLAFWLMVKGTAPDRAAVSPAR